MASRHTSSPRMICSGPMCATTIDASGTPESSTASGQQWQVGDVGDPRIGVAYMERHLSLLVLAATVDLEHHLVVTIRQHAAFAQPRPGYRPVELEHVVACHGSR